MAEVITSTGFKNALADRGIKNILNNFVLNIYSGTPPTSADDAETGQKLVTITKDGASWTASIAQEDYFAITGAGATNDTITVTITPSDASYQETYTVTQTGTLTTDDLARAVVDAVNLSSKLVTAVASTETTESAVILVGKTAGESYTVNVAVTGTITTSATGDLTPVISAVRGNGLHFEYSAGVSGGVIEKDPNEVWKGQVSTSGTASWFRIQANSDGGGLSSDAIRIQGNCSTSSDAPLQFAGTLSLTQGADFTIASFSIKLSL